MSAYAPAILIATTLLLPPFASRLWPDDAIAKMRDRSRVGKKDEVRTSKS